MRQVKRVPEDRELFEQLLLTRAVAVIAGQPERMQLPSRERVLSLLTDDENKTAIENAAYCAGEFVRRVTGRCKWLWPGGRYYPGCRQ
jgi:hypothetical protein